MEGGAFERDKRLLKKTMAIMLFLIYEVLLLKTPSANRLFCDTGLPFFPAFL